MLVRQPEDERVFGMGWESDIKCDLEEITRENEEWFHLVLSAFVVPQMVWSSLMKHGQ
jgi:hypothetical protein